MTNHKAEIEAIFAPIQEEYDGGDPRLPGTIPIATDAILALIDDACLDSRITELETINGNLELHVTAWRTLGKAGAVPSWLPKLDEFYVEWSKELADRITELKQKKEGR